MTDIKTLKDRVYGKELFEELLKSEKVPWNEDTVGWTDEALLFFYQNGLAQGRREQAEKDAAIFDEYNLPNTAKAIRRAVGEQNER